MRGLDPRIHALGAKKVVDGRIKSGHDEFEMFSACLNPL
jgi:hypothetical protein